jgi:maleylacetate reductase
MPQSRRTEALYARDRNPLSSALAVEGMQAFAAALPKVQTAPEDLDARGETLYGAWLCGTVLGQVGMALHHKLCHTLGGSFDLPHAETHAIVPDLLAPVGAAFGGGPAGIALHRFSAEMGAPLALKDIGLAEADLDRAADIATRNAYWNPAEVNRDGIRRLLDAAYHGRTPGR